MIKYFIHIILAFSVFFSSSGFWINSHFCQNELTKSALFLNFGSCCEEESTAPCDTEKMSCSSNEQDEKEGCCENKTSFFKLDQNQLLNEVSFNSFEHSNLLNAVIPFYNNGLPVFDKLTVRYLNYKPPLIVSDLQVQLQTFLC